MAWSFVITDLYGNSLGELNEATSRTVTLPHLRIPTASCTLPSYHPLASTIMSTRMLLKCYRTDPNSGTKSLAFCGPVVSREETNGDTGNTIQINAAGPYWRMTKRIIPASKLTTGVAFGSSLSPLDLGTIARTIISNVNAISFTGIDLGTQTATTTGWVGTWYLKNAAEGIAEIGAGLNTFEWRVRMTEPTAYANPDNWPRIGLFDVAPNIGQSRPDAIFTYGSPGTNNIASYTYTRSDDGILNDAIVSVAGWPDSIEKDNMGNNVYSLVERTDATTISSNGRFEEVISDAGVLSDSLRQAMADYHILLRKNGRDTITFKPSINAKPAPFVDYDVGDTVRAIAYLNGTLRFNALFRIWGVTFNIDQNGNENVDVELVMP